MDRQLKASVLSVTALPGVDELIIVLKLAQSEIADSSAT